MHLHFENCLFGLNNRELSHLLVHSSTWLYQEVGSQSESLLGWQDPCSLSPECSLAGHWKETEPGIDPRHSDTTHWRFKGLLHYYPKGPTHHIRCKNTKQN